MIGQMVRYSGVADHTSWDVSPPMVYCRFRQQAPITAIRRGPRGGLYCEIGGVWKYARKSRSVPSKAKQEADKP